MNSFSQFMKTHSIVSGDKSKPSTHTRIPDKDLNIYAGNYHIGNEDISEFNRLYNEHIFINGNKEYLTERQLEDNGTMVADLDFRYTHDTCVRQHNKDIIIDLLCEYMNQISKYFIFENKDSFNVFVMEKANVNRLSDGSLTKDGIHLMFNIAIPYAIQKEIRNNMIISASDILESLPLINDFDSVFDAGITKGTTNWNLIGSRKPGNEAYEITHSYNMVNDSGSFEFHDFKFNNDYTKVSVRNKNKSFALSNAAQQIMKGSFRPISSPVSVADIHNEVNPKRNVKYEEIKKHVENISEDKYLKSGKYDDWIHIIWALCSIGDIAYKEIAVDLAKRCGRDTTLYVEDYWKKYSSDKGITVATIFHYSKTSNEKVYNEIKLEYRENILSNLTIENMLKFASESDFASTFYKQFSNNLVLDGSNLYLYYNNEWRVENESKPNILINMIDTWVKEYMKTCFKFVGLCKAEAIDDKVKFDELVKLDKELMKMNMGIKRVNFCKNVACYLKSKMAVVFDKKQFDIGEQDHFNINFKNGVYEMKTGIFRDRCYYDYITKWLDYDYIKPSDIPNTINEDVYSFFQKIQPNEEQRNFTLGYLSYALSGNIDKQKFKMNVGYSAQNGKSTEMSIHDVCFPIYTKKLCRETFELGYSKRHKHLIDLLNNPIRLAYVEELSDKKLDIDFLKDFVDAKKISCEVMFGTDETKKIQAKLMTCSNTDFNGKTDEGIKRRGMIQHYNSKFLKDDGVNEFSDDTHIYKRIEGFENKFNCPKYKNAYFHLLIKYTDKLQVPKLNEDAFKEVCDDNDSFKTRLFEEYEVTSNENDVVYWKDICRLFGSQNGKEDRKSISNDMKRLNLPYNKDKTAGAKLKGCYTGLKLIVEDEEIEEI